MKKTTCLASLALVTVLTLAACGQPDNDDSGPSVDPASSQIAERLATGTLTRHALTSQTVPSSNSGGSLPDAQDGCETVIGGDGKPIIEPQTGQRRMQGCAYQTAPAFNSHMTTGFTLKTPTFTWNYYSYDATALVDLVKPNDLAEVACPYWTPGPPNGAHYLSVQVLVSSTGNDNGAPFPTSGLGLYYVPTVGEGREPAVQFISFHPAEFPGACESGLSGGSDISPEGNQQMVGSIPVPPDTDASEWEVGIIYGTDSISSIETTPGAGIVRVTLAETTVLAE